MDFIDNSGLIKATSEELVGEDDFLYSVEYQLLTDTLEFQEVIDKNINKSRISSGIYLQHPSGELKGNDAFMSRDNLIAIVGFSYKYKMPCHFEIWEEIKRQWFRYNNVNIPTTFWEKLTNKRFLQIPDIIFFGYCAESWICTLLLPVLFFSMLLSSLTKWQIRPQLHTRIYNFIHRIKYIQIKTYSTSNKLLNFVMLQSCKDNSKLWQLQWNWNTKIVKRIFGSWKKIFLLYFPFLTHPNVIASEKI
jgi:hypothetical protein